MARRKQYSAEFKRQALKRANKPDVTDALVCEELGISMRQLRRWRNADLFLTASTPVDGLHLN